MATEYGFKDKNKALDTIELLKEKEMGYQKLTVRGLLGRAKRVLSVTKAEEKIKNITEAMGVFEDWLKDHDVKINPKPSAPADKDAPAEGQKDKVPGLGFKDLAAAEGTIKALEGRDPKYQKLAIEGLLKSSNRVLSSTNNPDKLKSIKEAVKHLEKWLENFEMENRIAENFDYLEIDMIKSVIESNSYPVEDKDQEAKEFLDAYENQAKGNYKFLRTIYPEDSEISWDIVRNKKLAEIKKTLKKNDLFDGEKPTKDHLKLIVWAYSPVAHKLKSPKKGKRSNDDDESSRKKKK